MKPTPDMILYQQIKAKFKAPPETMLFISITSYNVDELVAVPFTSATIAGLHKIVDEHFAVYRSYATLGGFEDIEDKYMYMCPEFTQEESPSGEILSFDHECYRGKEIDLAAVAKDFKRLSTLLTGNT